MSGDGLAVVPYSRDDTEEVWERGGMNEVSTKVDREIFLARGM